jgi:hypothetical protein
MLELDPDLDISTVIRVSSIQILKFKQLAMCETAFFFPDESAGTEKRIKSSRPVSNWK